MSNYDPILTSHEWHDADGRHVLIVHGGLHYIKGNSAPYFSITADLRDYAKNGRLVGESGGCLHDEIERQWPTRFSDLIALHLSDISGVPMYFIANGWYDLAGALGGCGERYHLGNSDRKLTEEECLQIFADHCRIPLTEAQTIADTVRAELGPEQDSESIPAHKPSDYVRAKAKWSEIAATMTGRFQAEAKACIDKHGLRVYGDAWKAA